MNIVKRVKSYILFYWKKSVLILSVFTIMYSALFIILLTQENIDEMINNVGKNIGGILKIRVEEAAAYSYDESIYYPKKQMEKLEELEDVNTIEYIAMANARSEEAEPVFSELYALYHEGEEDHDIEDENGAGEITVIGVDDIDEVWEFKEREVKIRQGTGISDANKNDAVAVVSERFLQWNLLEIGDEISLTNTFDSSDNITLRIVGAHSGNEDYGDPAANPMNYIYVPLNQCLALNDGKVIQTEIRIKNPQKTDDTVEKIKSILRTANGDEKNFTIQKDCMEYLTAIIPLEGVKRVCNTMLLVVFGIFVLISYLLINNYVISKKKEMIIWLSLGEKKWKNFIQTEIEFLILSVCGGLAACIIVYIMQNSFQAVLSSYLFSIPQFDFYLNIRSMCVLVIIAQGIVFLILSLLYFTHSKRILTNYEV